MIIYSGYLPNPRGPSMPVVIETHAMSFATQRTVGRLTLANGREFTGDVSVTEQMSGDGNSMQLVIRVLLKPLKPAETS